MFEKIAEPKHVRHVEGEIPMSYRYTAGLAGERFLRGLKAGRILATVCKPCGVVYVPGRAYCERCMAALEQWKEVGPAGTVESVSVAHVGLEGVPLDKPQAYGLIRLDGATTVLFHRVAPGVQAGQRVKAVFRAAAKRACSINDIEHFAAGK
ncbi:MAG: Zn-ribbon domain-containing OB-fold protein [Actinomycetota bacterium]